MLSRSRLRLARTTSFLVVLGSLFADPAAAHVKWFAPYDCATAPRDLDQALNPSFWALCAGMLVLLWLICTIERTAFGAIILQSIERLSGALRPRLEDFYRALTAAFFVALFVDGHIILTPELKTDSAILPWLQVAIAAGMFWRSTLPLSALGIGYLYFIGVQKYGIFHMLDYPIFLGVAVFHVLSGFRTTLFSLRPLDCARWAASITLMWASIEKWAYPQWSYELLHNHSDLLLGMSPPFYMTFAGFVEFSLAFALIWTPLVRRLAAIVLATMFTSAVFGFGKIDAIGHLLIIMILVGIVADDMPKQEHKPLLAVVAYVAALGFFIAAYYGIHAYSYGNLVALPLLGG